MLPSQHQLGRLGHNLYTRLASLVDTALVWMFLGALPLSYVPMCGDGWIRTSDYPLNMR